MSQHGVAVHCSHTEGHRHPPYCWLSHFRTWLGPGRLVPGARHCELPPILGWYFAGTRIDYAQTCTHITLSRTHTTQSLGPNNTPHPCTNLQMAVFFVANLAIGIWLTRLFTQLKEEYTTGKVALALSHAHFQALSVLRNAWEQPCMAHITCKDTCAS